MAYDDNITKGSTSVIREVMVRDSTTGAGSTGLAHGSVTASYCRQGSTRTAITLASGTAGDAYSSGKWAEVDATNMPGLYQLHVPDAAFASGVDAVVIQLKASGVIDKTIQFALIDVNHRDATRGGMTALPNAAADAAGGLPISDTGGLDLDSRLDASVSSRSSHDAAAVLTAFGTGSTLTACATATGFSTHNASNVVTAFGSGSTLTSCTTATGFATSAQGSAIQAKTDNLPTDPADQSLVIAATDAILAGQTNGSIVLANNQASVTVGTVNLIADNAITMGSINDGAFTAGKFASESLSGKGDWPVGKTGYSLSTAGLALFMTTDTGETTAVAGSVAKIAQGSAGGNVTVGDLTQAALAQLVTDDTGETSAATGSVAKLAQGGAGSTDANYNPFD